VTIDARGRLLLSLLVLARIAAACGGSADRRLGTIYERGATLEQSSTTAALRGDVVQATALQGQAVAAYRSIDASAAAAALNRLGNLEQASGDRARAREAYSEALALARRSGDRGEEASAESNLGTIAEDSGDAAAARSHYEAARRLAASVGNRATEATALNNLALLAVHDGDDAQARALLDEAIALDRAADDAAGLAVRLRNLAALELRAGRLDAAIAALEEAHALDRDREDVPAIALDLVALSGARARSGDLAGAVSDRRRALEIHRLLGLDREVDHDRAAIGRWCGRLGDSLECDLEERTPKPPAGGQAVDSGLPFHRSAR